MRNVRFLPWVIALCAFGCTSAGRATVEPGSKRFVELRFYQSGQTFELASVSHTDPVDYYSDPSHSAARKVQDDAVMEAFVRELERRGIARYAHEGHSPSSAAERVRWALEVEVDGASRAWVVGAGTPQAELSSFGECRDLFLELYNATQGLQAVKNQKGDAIFQKKDR
jgi:hypothetical protein